MTITDEKKNNDSVLKGTDATLYFLKHKSSGYDTNVIRELKSYKKVMGKHLLDILPSIIFITLLSSLFMIIMSYSPNPMNDFSFLLIIIFLVLAILYFMMADFDKFRVKHVEFMKGNVIGTSKEKGKIIDKYFLIFLIDEKDFIKAQVLKKEYLEAKPNTLFWIFLEPDGLFAIKSEEKRG